MVTLPPPDFWICRRLLRRAVGHPNCGTNTSAAQLFDVAEWIARALGVQVKDLSDTTAALVAPPEVLAAWDAGLITVRQAARAAQLPPEERTELEEVIRSAEPDEVGCLMDERLEAAVTAGHDPSNDYLALIDRLLALIGQICELKPPTFIDPLRLAAQQEALQEFSQYVGGFADRVDYFNASAWLNRLNDGAT